MVNNLGVYAENSEKFMDNPFAGVATFMKAPLVADIDKLDADIAVLGMPYDLGSAVRAGARFAPRAVREASTWNGRLYNGWYDPLDDETYMDKNWRVADVGDVDVMHTEFEQSFINCEAAVRKILARGAIPFTIGGDHSITAPILRAFDCYDDICLVQFDAHLDYCKETAGVRLGQGNPMRRASEMKHIKKIVQIGMRGVGSSKKSDWDDARKNGNVIMNMQQVRENGVQWVIDNIPDARHYYVTFDIDGLDQTLAPGCGSPQPFGLYYEEVRPMLKAIAQKGSVVGFDMVEVCPPYDFNQCTALYAASVMFDMMSYIWKYKDKH